MTLFSSTPEGFSFAGGSFQLTAWRPRFPGQILQSHAIFRPPDRICRPGIQEARVRGDGQRRHRCCSLSFPGLCSSAPARCPERGIASLRRGIRCRLQKHVHLSSSVRPGREYRSVPSGTDPLMIDPSFPGAGGYLLFAGSRSNSPRQSTDRIPASIAVLLFPVYRIAPCARNRQSASYPQRPGIRPAQVTEECSWR